MRASRLRIAGATIAVVVSSGAAGAQGFSAYTITGVKCDGEVSRVGEPKPLQFRSDDQRLQGFPLQNGDKVMCTGPGQVFVNTPHGPKSVTSTEILIDSADAGDKAVADGLKKYGPAGGPRGPASAIIWPTMNSAVRPKEFAIRWEASPSRVTLMIRVKGSDDLVWGPTNADGEKGSLESAEARAALAGYLEKGETNPLILSLSRGDSSDADEATFSLFSPDDEKKLEGALETWDKQENRLAKSLGRGHVFMLFRRFQEAAREYELALGDWPKSPYLLEDARNAELLAGNREAAKKLDERLGVAKKDRNDAPF